MGKKLYVGNLSYDVTDSVLEQMCAQFGTVESPAEVCEPCHIARGVPTMRS